MTIALNNSTLDELSKYVAVPNYDRSALSVGIVHIGVGNFHRAHQAMYLHRLFNQGEAYKWAICGAGVKTFDAQMRSRLAAQDWLSSVVELSENKIQAQICGAMIDFVELDIDKLVERMASANVRIVSLTITEGGYFINPENNQFDLKHPEIVADIHAPEQAKTVFGVLIKALDLRRQKGLPGFTVVSCDNIPHNGDVAKRAVLSLAHEMAKKMDAALGTWIEDNVTFPNSMVDCIAPMLAEEQRSRIQNLYNMDDNAPVVCESFRQWVIEDKFVNGRPPLEKVGVQFVDNVDPYELMKLRMLNGGHAAIAYPAALMGIEYVHEAMQSALITDYLEKLIKDEVIPTLAVAEGIDFYDYLQVIKSRFANPEIKDTIERLYQDGQNRLPKFILPTVNDNVASKRSISGLSLVLALWCKLLVRATKVDSGVTLLFGDNKVLLENASKYVTGQGSIDLMFEVFGSLCSHKEFADSILKWLEKLDTSSVEEVLAYYVKTK